MKLINKTPLKTANLRVMLYSYAEKAGISTRGLQVEIRRARRAIHGLCFPGTRKILMWLFPYTKSQDIAFIWVHELQHLTPKNRRLWAARHRSKAQKDASAKALKVTGTTMNEVSWYKQGWILGPKWWTYSTKVEALKGLRMRQEGMPNKSFRLSPKSKRGCWRIERKSK